MHLIFKSLFFALNPKLSKSCDSYSCVHKRNSHPSKVLRSLQKNMVVLCHGREIGYGCWGVSLESGNHKINLCTFSLNVVDCSSTVFNLMVLHPQSLWETLWVVFHIMPNYFRSLRLGTLNFSIPLPWII